MLIKSWNWNNQGLFWNVKTFFKFSVKNYNFFGGINVYFHCFTLRQRFLLRRRWYVHDVRGFFQLLTDWLFWNLFVRLRVHLFLRTFLLTKISNNKYMFSTGLWSMYVFYFRLREGTNSLLLFFSFHAQNYSSCWLDWRSKWRFFFYEVMSLFGNQ